MDASVLAYLRYANQSLADATRISPSLSESDAVSVSPDELQRGQLGDTARRALLERARNMAEKQKKPFNADDVWPLSLVVIPKVFASRPEHGQWKTSRPRLVAPLLLGARLERDGNLLPEESAERQAFISRELLEPSQQKVTIGSVEAADEAYAQNGARAESWALQMAKGVAIIEAVTGMEYERLHIEEYDLLDAAKVVVCGGSGATRSIQNLTGYLLERADVEVPLLASLVTPAADAPLLDAREQLRVSAGHLGQMECRYGLSPSQREALAQHLAARESNGVLAVDGPPGTGKTTLLLSVIATHWVQHAVDGAAPPLIVATSTNNQAVTNILRAFAGVVEVDGPLAGRWLKAMKSYGLYMPAMTRKEVLDFPVHELRQNGRESSFDARCYEDAAGLAQGLQEFLERASAAFAMDAAEGLDAAVMHLQHALKDEVRQIGQAVSALVAIADYAGNVSDAAVAASRQQMQDQQQKLQTRMRDSECRLRQLDALQVAWAEHQLSEPLLIGLMAWIGLTGRRQLRNRAFWTRQRAAAPSEAVEALRDVSSAQVEAQLEAWRNAADEEISAAKAGIDTLTRQQADLQHQLQILHPLLAGRPLAIEVVQQALDMGARYRAFKLATHYWEGRYLQLLKAQLGTSEGVVDGMQPERVLERYRRLAMLHPCFVATLYTLPGRFTAFNGTVMPLLNSIDLLIADEAGQVPPEVAVASFALAKRAIVVGDVDQIEPIWAVPATVDLANARHTGVMPATATPEDLRRAGIAASNGSLMKMAQRATSVARFPERGRGMFLSEHRRCWKEIIQLCNTLVYAGRLQPLRDDNGVRPIQPSLGHVHIPGTDQLRGGSRENDREAQAIARWIGKNSAAIRRAYGQSALGGLIAVVTPFSAQARRVLTELNTHLGKGHGITVGTVHALQGAERRIVIFSPCYGLNTVPGSTFIDRNRSMLNVAISRAQDAFLVFGNMHLFRPEGGHPCAVVGRMLFDQGREIEGVDADLLVPAPMPGRGRLVSDLQGHRALLQEALITARRTLVIVSPFLTQDAIITDGIEAGIKAATARGVKVRVVTDPSLARERELAVCSRRLTAAGAQVRLARTQGVHSKLLLVDRSWFAIGSFNWLSAVRREGDPHARYESSLRYDGDESFSMITRTLEDIARLVAEVPSAAPLTDEAAPL
ncbi:AAA domain-containing protein [Stenotrophomonas tuberculopleuritidis]|uniref:AAA domain-containing protein n=1 Tax=Stenotrophomonas tuberculopleuritidis TaxID=3055079 RepID=UPI0026E52A65|nr:AAA domain-containing protein [Stenotrophomonas sp. 704A1]